MKVEIHPCDDKYDPKRAFGRFLNNSRIEFLIGISTHQSPRRPPLA